MCGIVGAISRSNVTPILLEGLKRLEYRGYDSAGMAVLNGSHIERIRTLGKVNILAHAVSENHLVGQCGIAHTRWATHGIPSEYNAHPHMSGETIAIVHNGIIENYLELRATLRERGYTFTSETDSEIAAHLLHYYTSQGEDFLAAIRSVANEMKGAFALATIYQKYPDTIALIRQGSPLVIGLGAEETFIASDPLAVLPFANKFIYLEEGDVALITQNNVKIIDQAGTIVDRPIQQSDLNSENVTKGDYPHFMLKEIFQQPDIIRDTIAGRLGKDHVLTETFGPEAYELFAQTKALQIVACGTSYHAGLVARHWCEELLGIHCNVEVASEFRYRKVAVQAGTLFITVSQSGETADTLAALRQAKQMGYLGTLSICNVASSSLVRESALNFLTRAGTEIGVASTKAFTSQLCAFFILILGLCRAKFDSENNQHVNIMLLKQLPRLIAEILELQPVIQQLATEFVDKENVIFLGRGANYPIALEGALKLKEISYIHAEAYPAGELKHGPLALIDKNIPVIAVAPNDELLGKLKSNLHEVQARGGKLYVFTDQKSDFNDEENLRIIRLPEVDRLIAPIAYTIPLQLLAYYVAVLRGTDVDQPRNLAKSVTVE